MYNKNALTGYRRLTIEEAEAAEKAIIWLASKRLKAENIALLTDRTLDRESKILYVKIETKHVIYYRKIRYQDSPLDTYLTGVLPRLKVERWLFPNKGWTGRKPSFGFHVHAEDVEKFLQNRSKKLLILHKLNATIETSTKKSNIQKQILVGRRIALRA